MRLAKVHFGGRRKQSGHKAKRAARRPPLSQKWVSWALDHVAALLGDLSSHPCHVARAVVTFTP